MTQKRRPRRLIEADEKQWARWDRFRQLEGVTFATFARRAFEQRCASLDELEQAALREPALAVRLPGLEAVQAAERVRRAPVRKTSPKKASRKATKKRRRSRG